MFSFHPVFLSHPFLLWPDKLICSFIFWIASNSPMNQVRLQQSESLCCFQKLSYLSCLVMWVPREMPSGGSAVQNMLSPCVNFASSPSAAWTRKYQTFSTTTQSYVENMNIILWFQIFYYEIIFSLPENGKTVWVANKKVLFFGWNFIWSNDIDTSSSPPPASYV